MVYHYTALNLLRIISRNNKLILNIMNHLRITQYKRSDIVYVYA